ncbi:hypothetical protein R1sor_022914 [Riccia sorocarpa]|uniref:DUF829 domain-containing protein n=1 Tax=Riccia sorocarpa TaxID=122646 RepID=A0ABD3GLZ3_9MARC
MMLMDQRDKTSVSGREPVYWRLRASSESDGIVVVIGWIFSKPQHLKHYAEFYASCNWDSLISHPKLLNLWFPGRAKNLALRILDKLSQELEKRPRPVVFATFSGGHIACLWKIYQVLQGTCDGVDCTLAKYKLVKDCFAGQIHDSSPVDFESDIAARVFTHPSVIGVEEKIQILETSGRVAGKVLDFFFLKRFQAQDLAMWTALHKSGEGGPTLVLCSRDDDFSPFKRIQEFCSTMTELGWKVTMVAWDESDHVDHFRFHEAEYKDAVRSLLLDAKTSHALKRNLKTDSSCLGQVELNQTNGTTARSSKLLSGQFQDTNFASGLEGIGLRISKL